MAGTTEAVVNVEIPVADVRRSADFYRIIGFALDREPSDEVAFLSAGSIVDRFGYRGIPEFGIILSRRDEFPLMRFASNRKREPVMVLQSEDAAAYRARLADSGIAVNEWHLLETSGCLLLDDPDGHCLGVRSLGCRSVSEFQQARELHGALQAKGCRVTEVETWDSPWNHHIMFDAFDPDGH